MCMFFSIGVHRLTWSLAALPTAPMVEASMTDPRLALADILLATGREREREREKERGVSVCERMRE